MYSSEHVITLIHTNIEVVISGTVLPKTPRKKKKKKKIGAKKVTPVSHPITSRSWSGPMLHFVFVLNCPCLFVHL